MDVNNMIAAMAAKTVDAMIQCRAYNAIAEAEGSAIIVDLSKYDPVPVFMAATPDFGRKASGRHRQLSERPGST